MLTGASHATGVSFPPETQVEPYAGTATTLPLKDMTALAKNGFRYPFPQYGIQQDVREGMAKSYPDRNRGTK